MGALGEALDFNYQIGSRIHYKLTKEHIEPTGANKIRNKLAEEVLSISDANLPVYFRLSREIFSNNIIARKYFCFS